MVDRSNNVTDPRIPFSEANEREFLPWLEIHYSWRYKFTQLVNEVFSLVWGANDDETYYELLKPLENSIHVDFGKVSKVWHVLHYLVGDVRSCKYRPNETAFIRAMDQKNYALGLIEAADILEQIGKRYQKDTHSVDRAVYLLGLGKELLDKIRMAEKMNQLADQLEKNPFMSMLEIISIRDTMNLKILEEIKASRVAYTGNWVSFEGSFEAPDTILTRECNTLDTQTFTFPSVIAWEAVQSELYEYRHSIPSMEKNKNEENGDSLSAHEMLVKLALTRPFSTAASLYNEVSQKKGVPKSTLKNWFLRHVDRSPQADSGWILISDRARDIAQALGL